MQPRRGLSVTEVLIAIFVMGIGMISLLALFPVGIANMNAALANSNLTIATNNAESLLEFSGLRTDVSVIGNYDNFVVPPRQFVEQFKPLTPSQFGVGLSGSLYHFLSDTANGYTFTGPAANPTGWTITTFDVDGTSPPVFVDPVGYYTYGAGTRLGTTVGTYLGIPRASLSWLGSGPQARRWFSLDDDMNFKPDATPVITPDPPTALAYSSVQRDRRYSWAYMVRRPRFNDPRVVEVSVVLFAGRKLEGTSLIGAPTNEVQYYGPSATTPTANRAFTQGQTTATIKQEAGQAWPPQVKTGDWVCDATCQKFAVGVSPARYNGYFYRIVAVSEPYDAGGGEMAVDLEMQTSARADGYVALFINGIVDVIEKSDGRMP